MPRSEDIAKGKVTTRSAKGKAKKQDKIPDFRFINIVFTEEMKENINAWLTTSGDLTGWVDTLVGQGYRVGLQFDEHNDCYSASITNRSGPVQFRNVCFTVRAGDVWTALGRAVAIHFGIAAEEWGQLEESGQGADIW